MSTVISEEFHKSVTMEQHREGVTVLYSYLFIDGKYEPNVVSIKDIDKSTSPKCSWRRYRVERKVLT